MGHANDFLRGRPSSSEESADNFVRAILGRTNKTIATPSLPAPLGRAFVEHTFGFPTRNGNKLVDRPRKGVIVSEDDFRMEHRDEDYHY